MLYVVWCITIVEEAKLENMVKKTPEQISYNMRQVKHKNSAIERSLRQELWSRGLRYRKNVKNILGKPDIVFIGKRTVVFCDSEFWHGFNWEKQKNEVKSNKDFWLPKIERNIERDKEVTSKLQEQGWTVLRFWGNEIKKNVKTCADIIEKVLMDKNNDLQNN